MPAEWAPHSAIWLSWPHDTESFPYLDKTEEAYADFIAEISESEKVELQIVNETMREKAEAMLRERNTDLGNVRFHTADYADIWFRDYGPLFVVNPQTKELAMTKWTFNAWGNKYAELLKDNKIPYSMNKSLKLKMFEAGIVLEGGSVEVNGKGTVLTTEQCLLNKNRNPHLSREQIEKYLDDYLGAPHVIWLTYGIEGDDTDGHIDDIARFVNETTVVCAIEENPKDGNYTAMKQNFEILKGSYDQDGKPLTVIPLPMPGKIMADSGKRLPASYANFYIGNTKVLVPIFGTVQDEKALAVIRSVFPDKKVVGINATYIVYGFGTFHCMSQQQPSV